MNNRKKFLVLKNRSILEWFDKITVIVFKKLNILKQYLPILVVLLFPNITKALEINAEDAPTNVNKGYMSANLGEGFGKYVVPIGTPLIGFGTSAGIGLGPMEYSSDGKYYGYKIGPDIFALFEGAMSFNTLDGRAELILEYDQAYQADDAALVGNSAAIQSTTSLTTAPNDIRMVGWESIDIYVYAGPQAVPGNYTIPTLYDWIYSKKGPVNDQVLLNSTTVTVKSKKLLCSISAPPTIDFGIVNITSKPSGSLLKSKVQGFDINCTSDNNAITADMNISFQGEFSNSYWGRLNVMNDAGAQIAYIRGRYLNDDGFCSGDSANEIGFNGTSAIKTLNNVGVGITKVPVTWSLCSNGSGLLGEGTSQATVNITWD